MRTYCIHTMNPFLGLGGTSEWRPVLSSSGFAWHCRPADGARGRQNKRKGYQILNNLYYWLKDGFCGVIQDTVAHTSVHNSNDSRTDKCVREDLPESDSCQLTSIVISTCSMTSTELPNKKENAIDEGSVYTAVHVRLQRLYRQAQDDYHLIPDDGRSSSL